jgi:hypothetical protein
MRWTVSPKYQKTGSYETGHHGLNWVKPHFECGAFRPLYEAPARTRSFGDRLSSVGVRRSEGGVCVHALLPNADRTGKDEDSVGHWRVPPFPGRDWRASIAPVFCGGTCPEPFPERRAHGPRSPGSKHQERVAPLVGGGRPPGACGDLPGLIDLVDADRANAPPRLLVTPDPRRLMTDTHVVPGGVRSTLTLMRLAAISSVTWTAAVITAPPCRRVA